MTEILLLSGMWFDKNICRGLSITKDFQIREISPKENSKFISNPATIKSPVIAITADKVKNDLFKLIDTKISESEIAEKYKAWISNFFEDLLRDNTKKMVNMIEQKEDNWKKFLEYLSQCRQSKNIKKRNVKMQLAKILYSKFWDDAFDLKRAKSWEKSTVCALSEKSLQYIRTIFFNANNVRESRWKSIDKVFHDWDYPFITNNILETENNYIDVLIYLIDKSKSNFYGKRWWDWQAEWSRKTSQYADILWTLTNDQLWIHKLPTDIESQEFQRDSITQNLSKIWWGLLENVITTHNMRVKSPEKKLVLFRRNKSIASAVEKTIEWRNLNDIIWLRISAKWISDHNFDDIKKISKRWIDDFDASLKTFPNKYVPKWYTINISQVLVDNKWVLDSQDTEETEKTWESLWQNEAPKSQVGEIVKELNEIVSTKKRENPKSPYIDQSDRENRMQKYYPEVVKNEKKWKTIKSFYKKIAWWKRRGKNWAYKDFKFNIKFDIKDKSWKLVWNRFMEVQFDDLANSKWLANYNIRNFERWLNTQSRLSFSVPLAQARRNCEKKLKEMRMFLSKWPKDTMDDDEKKRLFEIPFDDGSVVDISQFKKRSAWNSKSLDETIVKIINYFIKKWTFILCDDNKTAGKDSYLKDWLLNIDDLHDREKADTIHICSSLELSSQQHSYLQQNRDRKVWVYLEDENSIWRVTLWELIDSMNLWKVKDKKYSLDI